MLKISSQNPSWNSGPRRKIRKSKKVNSIDPTLKYLIEALSNYKENELCQSIIEKMETNNYTSEEAFVKELDEEETTYLNDVLENELAYAKRVELDERVKELTEIYELLF
jgi:hypothetical protein